MVVRVFNCITYQSSANYGYKIYVQGLLKLFKDADTMFVFPKGEEDIERYLCEIGSNVKVLFVAKTLFWTLTLRLKLTHINPKVIYHTMNYGLLLRNRKVTDVIVLHDLKWRHLGFNAKISRRLQRYLFMKIGAAFRNKFIAISDWTAYDYLCHTGRIIDGIIPNYISSTPIEITKKDASEKPYVLSISANEKYKDLNYLEESFHSSELAVSHQLIIVSRNYKKSNKATIVLSDLKNDEIQILVGGCYCIAITSLFEGFGFPYYEGLLGGKRILAYANPVALHIERLNQSISTYNKVDLHLKDLFNQLTISHDFTCDMSVPSKEMLLNRYLDFESQCYS